MSSLPPSSLAAVAATEAAFYSGKGIDDENAVRCARNAWQIRRNITLTLLELQK
jgi:hypothetical protein